MSAIRPALLLMILLLGGCASPTHRQLEQVLSGLDGELQRMEEELAAMNGLNYQDAADAPASLIRYLKAPSPSAEGLLPAQHELQDGPLLSYRYQLPEHLKRLPLDNPCLRYEFELRHLGHMGQLALSWQGEAGSGAARIRQRDCHFSAQGPGLQ